MPTLDSLFYKPGHQVLAVLAAAIVVAVLVLGGSRLFSDSARGAGAVTAANPVVAAPPQGLADARKAIQRMDSLDHRFAPSLTPQLVAMALAAVPGAHLENDGVKNGYGFVRIAVPIANKSEIYCIAFRGSAYPTAFACPVQ